MKSGDASQIAADHRRFVKARRLLEETSADSPEVEASPFVPHSHMKDRIGVKLLASKPQYRRRLSDAFRDDEELERRQKGWFACFVALWFLFFLSCARREAEWLCCVI